MEAMNIKITRAKYRSGIAFMHPFTESVPMKLQSDGVFWQRIQHSPRTNG